MKFSCQAATVIYTRLNTNHALRRLPIIVCLLLDIVGYNISRNTELFSKGGNVTGHAPCLVGGIVTIV